MVPPSWGGQVARHFSATIGRARVTSTRADAMPLNQNLETSMKNIVAIVALAATGLALPAWAATDAECQDMWKKADANSDGVLSDAEATRYVAFMRIGNRTLATEGRITQAEFVDACKADIYTPRKADDGAPLKGANSFTEGQAKDRATAQGVESVSGLKKDDDGIWRGTATQSGKTVQIAVDYKGNVVTTAEQ
jgi:hypothetical protein